MAKKRFFTLVLAAMMTAAGWAQVANDTTALLGTWTGKLEIGPNSLTLVLRLEKGDGYVKCTLDSPDQGAHELGCYKHKLTDDAISISVPVVGASYTAQLEDGKLVGTFSQSGIELPLTMTRGEYKPNRPQTPAEPYPYKTEEVSFFNAEDNATLVGTLTYPVGYESLKEVPVVIMVSGSGLQNRDEELFSHKPFLVIADHLARHGIASLRYDDRAFGASTGGNRIHNQAITPDYKRDAAAGVAFLRSLGRFGKVGALGHSEGGNVVFMLGADKVVDFIISMAGVGVRCDEALTAQYNQVMKLQGLPYEITVEQFRQNAKSAQSDWMDWFLDYDPTSDIAATLCPAMVINGDKDCQVISSLNLPAIERTLPHNEASLIKEYPSLNHLFQHCQTGDATEYNLIEETISPEVLNDISAWIGGLK